MMQFPGEDNPPLGVVFDSDLGNTIDDVLALALLQGFDGMKKPEARLLSVSITKSNLKAAAFCEVVDRFYSAIASREIPERFRRNRPSPVGFSLDGKMADDTPLLSGPLAMKNDKGEPLYRHEIEKLNDTAEAAALIRDAFTAQQDQNAVVVLTGPATNLAKVLELHGVKKQQQQKQQQQ